MVIYIYIYIYLFIYLYLFICLLIIRQRPVVTGAALVKTHLRFSPLTPAMFVLFLAHTTPAIQRTPTSPPTAQSFPPKTLSPNPQQLIGSCGAPETPTTATPTSSSKSSNKLYAVEGFSKNYSLLKHYIHRKRHDTYTKYKYKYK